MDRIRSIKILCMLIIVGSFLFGGNPIVIAGEPTNEEMTTAASQTPATVIVALEAERIAKEEQEETNRIAQALLGEEFAKYKVFGGYELWRLIVGLIIIILAATLNVFIRFYMNRRKALEDNKEPSDKKSFIGLVLTAAQTPACMVVWSLAIRLLPLVIFTSYHGGLTRVSRVIFSLAIALFIYKLVDVLEYYLKRSAEKTDSLLDDMLVTVVRKSLRVFIVIIVSLHIYNTYSEKGIATLLAGLGIGGLAFALASQDTIKNLFGFVMILADRPFVVGERVDLCGHDGVVESVGFRSVRVRRLDGHLVSIPNSMAADQVIRNIQRRPFIRRVMNITITYDTPLEKVEKGVEIVRDILKDHEGMNPEMPPRVYFNELNSDSLNILAIYWYHPPAYWDYLDHAQRINLELMKRFEAEGIEFAFPTQTLYLAGDPKRELIIKGINGEGGLPG